MSNSPQLMSTNLGKLGIPDEIPGIQIERAFFAPSSAMGMEIVLGVTTVNGKLTITLNYYEGYVDGKTITTADVERALRMRYGPQLESMNPQQRAMAIKQ